MPAGTDEADTAPIPKTNEPTHPALPERTIPAPPVVAPSPAIAPGSAPAKAPLAWRQKALCLSMEKFKALPASAQSSARTFASSYSETLAALTSSCAGFNFRAEQLNSNAGELLVSSPDGKIRLVFCIWEQGGSKTAIAAGVDRGKGAAATKAINDILDSTGNTVSHRGRI